MQKQLQEAEEAANEGAGEVLTPADLDSTSGQGSLRSWLRTCYKSTLELMEAQDWSKVAVPKKLANQYLSWKTNTDERLRFKKYGLLFFFRSCYAL